MNLLFLSIKSSKGLFKDVNITFDNRWKFDIDESRLVINCSKRDVGKELMFTTSLLVKETPVSNVNVIVGPNGAGKTSLAAILATLDDKDANESVIDCTMIFSVKSNDKWFCYARREGKVVNFTLNTSGIAKAIVPACESIKAGTLRELARFVYLTPHFTVEDPFFNKGFWFKDISTTGLLISESEADTNEISALMGNVPQFGRSSFAFYERLHVLEFIKAFGPYKTDKDPIPMPMSIIIEPNFEYAHKLKVALINEAKREKLSEQGIAWSTKFISMLDRAIKADFFEAIYLLLLVGFGYESMLAQWDNDIYNLRTFAERWNERYLVADIKRDLQEVNSKNTAFINLMHEIVKANDAGLIQNFAGKSVLAVASNEVDKIFDVVDAYKAMMPLPQVLKINFDPVISSGEMNFLTMFGRVYSYVLEPIKERRTNVKDVVLFFDEIETTLHPMWQRELVWNWLWFFETFAKDCSVHLIFASHSPLLLSDIPSSNAIFLKRKKIKCGDKTKDVSVVLSNGKVIKKALDMQDTFFANIQDLYALPFVLKDGVVGKRAELLLREALDKKADIQYEDRQKVIESVGDPIVRSVALETLRLGGYKNLKKVKR